MAKKATPDDGFKPPQTPSTPPQLSEQAALAMNMYLLMNWLRDKSRP